MANKTITVLEADGVTETDIEVLDVGRQAAAASKSTAMATEDKAVLDAISSSLTTIDGRVDGLETLITSTNTKLDTAITALQIIDNMVLQAGTNNIGDVDVLTVPTDPFGANADAASATGSISAKLRALATALGTTALDLGVGTGGSRTLRVAMDSGQLAPNRTTVGALSDGFQQVDIPTDGTAAARMGSLTETAPASDTASSGLNGRLQRIAQRITSLIALFPTSLGAQTQANSLGVAFPTDVSASKALTLTRPNDTTAYTANDVLGAATGSTAALQFTNMGRSGSRIMITGCSLEIDASAIITNETSYDLHLYNVTPPSALGDNAAWDLPSGDRASYLGKISLGAPADLGSTLYVETFGLNKQVQLSGTDLFGYLVTVGGYTPTANRVYIPTIHAIQI